MSDDALQGILERGYSSRRTLELMLEAALDHGGRDNITGILLSLDDPALPLPLPGEGIQVSTPALETGNHETGVFARIGRIFSGRT